MMDLAPGAANRLWLLQSLAPWRAFQMAALDPRGAQVRCLRSILRRNRHSEYGMRFRFEGIRTVEEFQRRVPAVRYDDVLVEMEAIRRGREGVLTTEPVLRLHPSSGSTAPTKLIPYTASLKRQLHRAVSVWIADLFWNRPDLMDGPSYWAISPALDHRVPFPGLPGPDPALEGWGREGRGLPDQPGVVQVGFDEDAEYLGGLTRAFITGALAVPPQVGLLRTLESHRYATLRYLLGQAEIRILSVWSPTFLSLLLEPLESWWDRLVNDVEAGTLSLPAQGEAGGGRAPEVGVTRDASGPLPLPPPDPRRARELEAVGPEDLPGIWPRLGLISAWGDGSSAPYAVELNRAFPGVPFQSKGLIATEAFVTIPRWGVPGAQPAITSHFLEFLPEGAGTHEARLADGLEEGERYEVLVTTAGGLYRYRLGDVVEVTEHWGGLPLLRFMGRADRVSDRFGEKLSDGFVTWALQELCAAEDLDPSFSLLAPEEEKGRTRYVWYVRAGEEEGGSREADHRVPGVPEVGDGGGNPVDPRPHRALQALASRLDEVLSANFHYATCRRLGQLDPPELRRVPRDAPLRYLEARGRAGGRLGDVKIPSLEATSGWAAVLRASVP